MFTIYDVIATLNKIEVKGKENIDRLLGAIIALEEIQKALENDGIKAGEEVVKDG
jgi:hypothetical protein